jgi:molybdate transport system substrate-binding protein
VTTRKPLLAAAVAAVLLTTTACGADTATPALSPGPSGGAATGTITVLAAASLTGTFTAIGKDFEAANPGTTVRFSFAGSAQLATQITAGAPADVFAAASPATMKTVVDAGDTLGTPLVFVKNQLVIVVPKGNPKKIAGIADVAKPGVKVALCAEQVPCGAAATKAIAAAGLALTPVTLEQDVKQALSKVTLGEADAALVYRTDARAAAAVDGVEFPESAQAVNDYPVAVLKNAPNVGVASAFVEYVLSDEAGAVLTGAGFQKS